TAAASAMVTAAGEVELVKNTMTAPLGFDVPGGKPICHFARYQEVLAWPVGPLPRMHQVYG
ncbi:MAG TPA: hypothetical protein VJQ55_10625, partial [Candidatus Binatia bacterium]|nr:hypothetical protein [Candidatus Binatia bacterium]